MFPLKVDDLVEMLEKLLQFVLVAHPKDLVIIQMLPGLEVIVHQEWEAITRQGVHPEWEAVIFPEGAASLLAEVLLEVEVHHQKGFQKEAVNI